jgi:predicted O-linked N-acetylglucosamine transferase (SPINDLY family)
LPTIDYLIADATLIPPEQEHLYREQIIRLPDCFLCFHRPLPEAPLPTALSNGFVTFGWYNNLPKVSPTTIKLWAKILHAVPNSRLVLKTLSFRDTKTQALFWQHFSEAGIPRQRIDLLPPTTPLSAFLAEYARIESTSIALDPIPYNGGTTTCDALWMGVPVITLTGNTFYSRMSSSILQTIGLPHLITSSQDAYLERAKELAQDIEQLTTLHSTLRQRIIASPLYDAKRFTQNFERLLYKMVIKLRNGN